MKFKINPVILSLFVLFIFVFSCKKENLGNNTCEVKDPVKDIAWIKNDIYFINSLSPDDSQFMAIMMAKYNGVTVFYTIFCNPDSEPAYPLRNCAGETIGYYGAVLPEDLKEQMVIWKSEFCICVF
jgi:hypothetical protein